MFSVALPPDWFRGVMNLLYFLGRFHVQVLHLPITLVLLVFAFEYLSRRERYRVLSAAMPLLWGLTAASAVVAAVLGYVHFQEGGFETSSGVLHQYAGLAVACLCVAGWIAHTRARPLYDRGVVVLGVVLLLSIVVTGHTGGNLTHGAAFMVEYGPQPLRALAGLEAPRPPVTDLAQADPFHDVVRPILVQRCSSCHGPDKIKGSLQVTSHEALLGTGDSGAAGIVPGDVEKSEVLRRVLLPSTDEERMPAEGQPGLSEGQIALLRWWIETGAPQNVTLGELAVPDDVRPSLLAAVGLGGGAAAPGAEAVVAADQDTVSSLDRSGFIARQLSRSDALLAVRPVAPGGDLAKAQLDVLAAASPHIAELDLSHSNLEDAELEPIAKLTRLTHLELQGNRLTDAGVRTLQPLSELRVLNLYGNRSISNASLTTLAALPRLERVYLWQTSVTPAGVADLRRRRPELVIDLGDNAPRAAGT